MRIAFVVLVFSSISWASPRIMKCEARCSWTGEPKAAAWHMEIPSELTLTLLDFTCGSESYRAQVGTGTSPEPEVAETQMQVTYTGTNHIRGMTWFRAFRDPIYTLAWTPAEPKNELAHIQCRLVEQ